ncbi:Nuclear receptor domain-containing protein [Caenorhabditis elegans]|uniref:Nuclear receptor domain-containing protein n=1 Tax=Caenorhabditis elegans TaxID=6239 RepID=O45910_CAEEL|nr:Nuclear receptor domain-containing protein [Caenorhabditis elegans]CAA16299.2 Nuclear receptor domain-containing protein [Caenorhabditis elegans]|eukprot:NP_507672.2 Nuclear Hormone Receptor family [Caenorhabditis elegans]
MNIPCATLQLNYTPDKCEICQKTGHGHHFGLETCRACAAFFRRTVVLNRKYKCAQKSGKCDVGAEKATCKFCRYKKCIDLGMTTDNVRAEDITEQEPASSHLPEAQILYTISSKSRGSSLLVDVNAVLRKSKAIMEDNHNFYVAPDLNPLQMMVESLHKIRSKQSGSPEFFTTIKFGRKFQWWAEQLEDTATWLMNCREFRGLPIHEKLAIFKIVWAVWRRFERYTMSAEVFGQKCYDEKILLHSHKFAARFGSYCVDYSHVWSQGPHTFENVFGGKMIRYFDIIVKPYLELNLSETEVTYILCQIVWNYAGRRLQGQTQAAGERFLEEISNNLHSYYEEAARKEENPKNYASRLTKMMQIVNEMLKMQLKQETDMDLALLFDMFNISFTEPEFFRV